MNNANDMSLFMVIVLTFSPMLICGSLLRTNGAAGLLAIAGAVAMAAIIFSTFQDGNLVAGSVAALVGLVLGGKISDARELKRMQRAQTDERRRRDAMAKRS